MTAKRIGILTGGGDCPGLNAVIRAVVRCSTRLGSYRVTGIRYGWRGLVQNDTVELTRDMMRGILYRGGTILGTSRTNLYKDEATAEKARKHIRELGLHAIIAIGGEDTLGVAKKLSDEGFPVVGVPKTIDNDLRGTDFTFGFDTAVQIATEAIDRLHTTAESHDRVLVCEVMGRHAGWIATYAGLAGGADAILVPEHPIDVNEIYDVIAQRKKMGVHFSIIVVAEGAKIKEEQGTREILVSEKRDEFGHVQLGGIGEVLAKLIEKQTGCSTRVTILGHIQRGGTPTAHDRVLATRFGVAAMSAVHAGRFGIMVGLSGKEIVDVPLAEIAKGTKVLDDSFYQLARSFWG